MTPITYIHKGNKIVLSERENFWDADIHFGQGQNLYAYAYLNKSGNRTDADLLLEAYQIIDDGIAFGMLNKPRKFANNDR